MARSARPVYDPHGHYIARVDFSFNGVSVKAGADFNKGKLTDRKVRILYDARRIELYTPTPKSFPFPWRELTGEDLLAYAFELTGIRFRKVERAVKVLTDLE